MLFYGCGISGRLLGSHDVSELASKLREEIGIPEEKDMQSVRRVAKYYLSTRYPNRQPFNVVPAEAFNKNEAEMAVGAASKVLELVDEYCSEE
jgi:HEPN domain-containing protein